MGTSLIPQAAKKLIESTGLIHMHAFKIALGILTGLALCCFLARITIRLVYQKSLKLDDAFLIISVACLCAATGIIYHICYFLYMHSAALLVPELTPYLLSNFSELMSLQEKVYPFLALAWTTVFGVKGCFLVFMRPLVWHISRWVNRYYWFVVVFSVISWAFNVSMPFIVCPYFGIEAVKCFASTVDEKKTLALSAFVNTLDVLSDFMVVSLPIIVLKGSQLSRSTKWGLAVFLCLSIFMAACAIIRCAGFRYKGLENDIWMFFWQHVEGAVSVMMASITAFRTLFVKPTDRPDMPTPRRPIESLFDRIFRRFQSLAREQPAKEPIPGQNISRIKLPNIPSPTFTGVRTFIWRNSRAARQTDMSAGTFNTLESEVNDIEVDYHAALKGQHGVANGKIASCGA